jgi:nucleoside-diphosphate-sugar epimerase
MKNILVTGGAGFLGRNLCKKLLENPNNNVICLDNLVTGSCKNIEEFEKNPNFTFIRADVTQSIQFPILHEIYHMIISELY